MHFIRLVGAAARCGGVSFPLDGSWTGPAHLRPTSFSIAASWCGSTPSAFITALMMQSDRMSSSVGSYCRQFRFIHFLAGGKTTMAY